jgi:hypothetical protein
LEARRRRQLVVLFGGCTVTSSAAPLYAWLLWCASQCTGNERVKRYVPYKEALGNNCLSVEEGDEEISVHNGDQLYVNFSRDKIYPVPEKKFQNRKKKNQRDINALKLALLEVGIITKRSKYLFIPVYWDKRKAANGF